MGLNISGNFQEKLRVILEAQGCLGKWEMVCWLGEQPTQRIGVRLTLRHRTHSEPHWPERKQSAGGQKGNI